MEARRGQRFRHLAHTAAGDAGTSRFYLWQSGGRPLELDHAPLLGIARRHHADETGWVALVRRRIPRVTVTNADTCRDPTSGLASDCSRSELETTTPNDR